MTLEELKEEANKLGYKLNKKPNYDCHCFVPYPNKNCKFKNGKWKCVDRYINVQSTSGDKFDYSTTKCVRKDKIQKD